MAEPDPSDARGWESGWQGHADAQRARVAALPLNEKLRWLEEAQHLLVHLRRGPARRRDVTKPGQRPGDGSDPGGHPAA